MTDYYEYCGFKLDKPRIDAVARKYKHVNIEDIKKAFTIEFGKQDAKFHIGDHSKYIIASVYLTSEEICDYWFEER